MKQTINISTSTILRFILIILGLLFLYLIKDVLLMVFIAMIIAAAIDAPVDWLAKRNIKRMFGTAIVYLLIFLILAGFMYLVLPPLAGQLKLMAANLPGYLDQFGTSFDIFKEKIGVQAGQTILDNFSNQLYGAASNIFGTAVNIFGGLFSALIILVISVYLVIQDKGIKKFLGSITPIEHRAYVANLAERIQGKLGGWLRGQLILMVIVGALSFVGLSILNVNYALTLALIAGLLEIIPYIGPILGAIPAMAIAFMQSPILALFVAILYIIIQKAEGYLIVPLVMRRTVGLNPLVVMLSIIIGGKLGGIVGVVVAVPVVAAASVFFGDLFVREESK